MTPDAARDLAGALTMLVLGTIVVVVDLSIDDFDIVADGVGHVVIAVAGFRIARTAEVVGQHAARAAARATGFVASILAVLWVLDVATGGWAAAVPGGEWIGALLGLAPLVVGIWLLVTLSQWMTVAAMPEEARRLRTAAFVLGVTWGLLTLVAGLGAMLLLEARPGGGVLAFGGLLVAAFLGGGAYTAAVLMSTARALRRNADLAELAQSAVVAAPEVQREPTGEERHQ